MRIFKTYFLLFFFSFSYFILRRFSYPITKCPLFCKSLIALIAKKRYSALGFLVLLKESLFFSRFFFNLFQGFEYRFYSSSIFYGICGCSGFTIVVVGVKSYVWAILSFKSIAEIFRLCCLAESKFVHDLSFDFFLFELLPPFLIVDF